ncbi:MAG TPA: hypothetical protein VI758_00840 [Bacteroidota bacterium]
MKRIVAVVLVLAFAAGTLIPQDKPEKKEAAKQETMKEKCETDGCCCCCKKDGKMMKMKKMDSMKCDSTKAGMKCEMKNEESKK